MRSNELLLLLIYMAVLSISCFILTPLRSAAKYQLINYGKVDIKFLGLGNLYKEGGLKRVYSGLEIAMLMVPMCQFMELVGFKIAFYSQHLKSNQRSSKFMILAGLLTTLTAMGGRFLLAPLNWLLTNRQVTGATAWELISTVTWRKWYNGFLEKEVASFIVMLFRHIFYLIRLNRIGVSNERFSELVTLLFPILIDMLFYPFYYGLVVRRQRDIGYAIMHKQSSWAYWYAGFLPMVIQNIIKERLLWTYAKIGLRRPMKSVAL